MEENLRGSIWINIGCGIKYWDGWINADISKTRPKLDMVFDARVLPFKDNSADVIAAIHVIEHFFLHEAKDMLKEWQRVLKPGGLLILELPCMDKVFHYIAQCITKKQPLNARFSYWPIWGKYENNNLCNDATAHKWGYTKSDLKSLLEYVGYRNVINRQACYHEQMRDMRFEATK